MGYLSSLCNVSVHRLFCLLLPISFNVFIHNRFLLCVPIHHSHSLYYLHLFVSHINLFIYSFTHRIFRISMLHPFFHILEPDSTHDFFHLHFMYIITFIQHFHSPSKVIPFMKFPPYDIYWSICKPLATHWINWSRLNIIYYSLKSGHHFAFTTQCTVICHVYSCISG